MFRRSAAAILVLGVSGIAADAQPPPNADPALHGWFESLKQPGTGASCCSIADCRPVDYRMGVAGYEAFLDARWVKVPDERVLRGMSNPTERGVLCRAPTGAILCFVPANET